MRPLSPQAVGTPLMLHQRQALSWMCAQENKSSLPPFWEKRGDLYYNSLTCFSANKIPERVRGGILADDMGLVSNTHTHISSGWESQETPQYDITAVCFVLRYSVSYSFLSFDSIRLISDVCFPTK